MPPAQTISSTCSKKKLLSTLCVIYCHNLLQDFSALLNEAGLFSVHIVYPCLVTPSHIGKCLWVPWFSQLLVGEGLQIPSLSIDPCMEPAGCITSSKVAALGSQQCSCCLTHEHCLPQGFQQLPTVTVSPIAEISDLIKDLHVSADVATSANYGLSSVEGGVYAYILILVCIVV